MAFGHLHIRNKIGSFGEDFAVHLLEQKNYSICERNWKCGHLEVDIIAENDTEIIFVEVKTRTSDFIRRPEERVNREKQKNIIIAANAYIKWHQTEKRPRFDIIGVLVDLDNMTVKDFNHIEDAYMPHVRTIHAGSYSGQWKWHNKQVRQQRKSRFNL